MKLPFSWYVLKGGKKKKRKPSWLYLACSIFFSKFMPALTDLSEQSKYVILAAVTYEYFFFIAFCFVIIEKLLCWALHKCYWVGGYGHAFYYSAPHACLLFSSFQNHTLSQHAQWATGTTGHLSAEDLTVAQWGGPFEHYIQSKCHLQPRCKTLMIWPWGAAIISSWKWILMEEIKSIPCSVFFIVLLQLVYFRASASDWIYSVR